MRAGLGDECDWARDAHDFRQAERIGFAVAPRARGGLAPNRMETPPMGRYSRAEIEDAFQKFQETI